MDMSQPDDDGVYRNGATKRKARTELAMQCLTELWNAACKDVSFPVPDSGIGFAAVGSLARGQLGPSSDLDLVIIYEPRTLSDQQLNELANNSGTRYGDSGLGPRPLHPHARPNARKSPTMTFPPPWAGWT